MMTGRRPSSFFARLWGLGLLAAALVACGGPKRAVLLTWPVTVIDTASVAGAIVGVAELEGRPFAAADVRILDLVTGQPVMAAGGTALKTDAMGKFQMGPRGADAPALVKVVATRGSETLITIFSFQEGRGIDEPVSPGAFRLMQNLNTTEPALVLNLASTAAAQAFEGAFKMQMRARDRRSAISRVMSEMNRSVRLIEQSMKRMPSRSGRLKSNQTKEGKVRDASVLAEVLKDLDVLEDLSGALNSILEEAVDPQATLNLPPGLVTQSDFPIGAVVVSASEISFTNAQGQTLSKKLQPETNMTESVKNETEIARPVPSATPRASSGGGGSGRSSGAVGAVAAPKDSLSFSLDLGDRYSLRRIAGDDQGGAGSGASALTAAFRGVSGVVVTADGTLFVADPKNHQIRRSVGGGPAERVAGSADGTPGFLDNVSASVATFHSPAGLLWDETAGLLLVCDSGNGRVRFVRPGGTVGSLAGGGSTNTSPTTAMALRLEEPVALTADQAGTLYVADRAGGKVWRIASNRTAVVVAATPGASALALDAARDVLWVGTSAGQVLRVTTVSGAAALDVATSVFEVPGHGVQGLAVDPDGLLFVLAADAIGHARLWRVPVDSAGQIEMDQQATAVAGTDAIGTGSVDYSAPIEPLAQALDGRLSVLHPGSLFIDWSAADAPATPAGQIYIGASFDDGAPWGQVLRLDPAW